MRSHLPTHLVLLLAALTLPLLLAGCSSGDESGLSPTSGGSGSPSDQPAWNEPIGGEWTMAAGNYANTRFSALDEITPGNVSGLKLAWSFSDGVLHGHEAAPLVRGNTMYLISPYPNTAYALDLTRPSPWIKWKYEPEPSPVAMGKACCDVVNRGGQIADGKLIYNLLDAHTVAVDIETGQEVWRTKLADVEDGVTMTMAPLVVGDRVLVGNSGGEMGVHGWLAALDVGTGEEVWRAYSTGPDSLTRIGSDFEPFYDWMKGEDMGATTWPADAWKHGAGAAWGWVSYDPELDLIYYGTSNTGPWNAEQRPGLNLWTSGVIARRPEDGMARWAFVFTPHNEWDYDGVNENILVDLEIDGRARRTMVQFNRNGYAYTIDRETGEVLVAEPFGFLNWSSGIDPVTKQPIVVDSKRTSPPGRWVRNICPADIGVKDWQPAAFSPRTGLFYVPVQNICMDYRGNEVGYIAGTPYWGAEMKRSPGPSGHYGNFIAWDAATGRTVWSIDEDFLPFNGALATASDLVFYGTADGWFRAVDARSGDVLWSQKLSSGVSSPPMTYTGPDGHQYVAVWAGVGGGAMVTAGQPGFPARGGTLYVFTLEGANPPATDRSSAGAGPTSSPTDAR